MSTTSDSPLYGESADDADEGAWGAERSTERTIGDAAAERAIGAAAPEHATHGAAGDDRIRRPEDELAEILDQNLRKVREYIEKNPVQSAAIAFAAGVVLSSLLRR